MRSVSGCGPRRERKFWKNIRRRSNWTISSQFDLAQIHSRTRRFRYKDGIPRIAYLADQQNRQFYEYALTVQQYGICPVWLLPESDERSTGEPADWNQKEREGSLLAGYFVPVFAWRGIRQSYAFNTACRLAQK